MLTHSRARFASNSILTLLIPAFLLVAASSSHAQPRGKPEGTAVIGMRAELTTL